MEDPSVRRDDLATSANALFAVDRDQTIIVWSPGAEALLGRRADATIGKKCYTVIGGRLPSGRRLCCAGCKVKTQAHRKPEMRDFDVVVQDGRGRCCSLTFSTVGLPAAGNHCTVHVMRLSTNRVDRRTISSSLPESRPLHATPREIDVLRALAGGGSTAQIARGLCISQLTVRTHVRSLLRKHNLHSRAQLLLFALRNDASS